MLDTLLAKVVGTQNDRELKRLRPIVVEVNTFEPAITALSDDQLRGKRRGRNACVPRRKDFGAEATANQKPRSCKRA